MSTIHECLQLRPPRTPVCSNVSFTPTSASHRYHCEPAPQCHDESATFDKCNVDMKEERGAFRQANTQQASLPGPTSGSGIHGTDQWVSPGRTVVCGRLLIIAGGNRDRDRKIILSFSILGGPGERWKNVTQSISSIINAKTLKITRKGSWRFGERGRDISTLRIRLQAESCLCLLKCLD